MAQDFDLGADYDATKVRLKSGNLRRGFHDRSGMDALGARQIFIPKGALLNE